LAATISTSTLDTILALQLTVAWAGESREHTNRLGWWHTDLVDATGGGDFMARLLPRTYAWASLEAVREAARRVDEKGRRGMADPDQVRSLYFLGFDVDEHVSERLAEHKRSGVAPAEALTFPQPLDGPLTAERFAESLRAQGKPPAFDIVPGGRQLKGPMPEALDLAVRGLAAALVPPPDRYPLPFYRLKP
jgi:hypothetical protein